LVFVNNRAGGNAPLIAQKPAERFEKGTTSPFRNDMG